ncbi:hypothetical protein Tco_0111357 [Tanacetum coccineum]
MMQILKSLSQSVSQFLRLIEIELSLRIGTQMMRKKSMKCKQLDLRLKQLRLEMIKVVKILRNKELVLGKRAKPVWDNTKRVNHQNFSKYPHLSKTFVPSGVLTRTGLHRPSVSTASPSINTARPVCTARPSINTARPVCTARPSINTARPICTARPSINIARPVCTARAVVNTGKGKLNTDLKKSRWVWRPKGNYLDHVSKDSGSFMLKKGNPNLVQRINAMVIVSCSSHMTGNKAYLSDYEDFNGGFVAFGSDPKGGKITGKGKIKTANLDFDDVYFVDELNFKFLDESQVVLRAPRKDGMYSLDLKNIIPSRGKFDGKSDEGYLLGYSTSSKAF